MLHGSDGKTYDTGGTIYTRSNPVNQVRLDQRYGFADKPADTRSCKTAATINAYASLPGGIALSEIDRALRNPDGSIKPTVSKDGSPADNDALSKDLARAMGRQTYLKPEDAKSADGVGTEESGIMKMMRGDTPHYVYKDPTGKVDSMDPTRPNASLYKDSAFQRMTEQPVDPSSSSSQNEQNQEEENQVSVSSDSSE